MASHVVFIVCVNCLFIAFIIAVEFVLANDVQFVIVIVLVTSSTGRSLMCRDHPRLCSGSIVFLLIAVWSMLWLLEMRVTYTEKSSKFTEKKM